ncbi:MAG: xseB [Armatimonadetes bacterium]|jgi:exodeoxyribonuclease VII small subunit|nr:xseB [Armatimonadota bacterium]
MSERYTDLSFEQAVSRLEEIVSAMEAGNLPLDDCLRQFEDAVSLSRHCAAKLDAAEQKITVLSTDGASASADELPWVDPPRLSGVAHTRTPNPGGGIQTGFDWDS